MSASDSDAVDQVPRFDVSVLRDLIREVGKIPEVAAFTVSFLRFSADHIEDLEAAHDALVAENDRLKGACLSHASDADRYMLQANATRLDLDHSDLALRDARKLIEKKDREWADMKESNDALLARVAALEAIANCSTTPISVARAALATVKP